MIDVQPPKLIYCPKCNEYHSVVDVYFNFEKVYFKEIEIELSCGCEYYFGFRRTNISNVDLENAIGNLTKKLLFKMDQMIYKESCNKSYEMDISDLFRGDK